MVTKPDYYKKNKEKILAQNKRWRDNNLEYHRALGRAFYQRDKRDNKFKYLLKYAKARAKKRGLEFSLTEEWVQANLPDNCPILGLPLDWDDLRLSPSLDKINPKGGYTPDNCWIVSTIANKMMQDSTTEELELFSRGILRLLEGGNLP